MTLTLTLMLTLDPNPDSDPSPNPNPNQAAASLHALLCSRPSRRAVLSAAAWLGLGLGLGPSSPPPPARHARTPHDSGDSVLVGLTLTLTRWGS